MESDIWRLRISGYGSVVGAPLLALMAWRDARYLLLASSVPLLFGGLWMLRRARFLQREWLNDGENADASGKDGFLAEPHPSKERPVD